MNAKEAPATTYIFTTGPLVWLTLALAPTVSHQLLAFYAPSTTRTFVPIFPIIATLGIITTELLVWKIFARVKMGPKLRSVKLVSHMIPIDVWPVAVEVGIILTEPLVL